TVLEEARPQPERALSSDVARQISNILSDNVARAPAFGENSALYIPTQDVAVKTGTTNDSRDAWIMGYTPYFTLGAWAGNNDNTPMVKKVAGLIVAPMWNEFMREAIKKFPAENFPRPLKPENHDELKPVIRGEWRGGDSYAIDTRTGTLANETTPGEFRQEKVISSVHSILYWVDRRNPLGPKPQNPQGDSQFELWETPVREWATKQGYLDQDPNNLTNTTSGIQSSTGEGLSVKILTPTVGSAFTRTGRLNVSLATTEGKAPIAQVDFFVNSTYIGSSKSLPYSFSFVPENITGIQGVNTLRVVEFDSLGNHVESQVQFSII
ncbi:MAG: Ig-like domain-containing protein, partial [Patescibacteria group bacterium]